MNDIIKDLFSRFTGRKFLLALGGSFTAFEIAAQDNLISISEIALILAPIVTFIVMEGAADVATRFTNIPKVEPTTSTKTSKK
jgi:hypothetical protein